MKAERRHELKQNSLVRGVNRLPEFWATYGSKVALGAILVLLAVVLVRLWSANRADAKTKMAEELTAARSQLESLRLARETPVPDRFAQFQQQFAPPPYPQEQIAQRRKEVYGKVDSAVTTVLRDSSEPAQQAEAKLLRADLNYHFALLAMLGDLPAAATRPALALGVNPTEAMERAATNYTEVINQAAALPASAVASARLGLAAVSENRKDFAKARELYEAVVRQGGDEGAKALAEERLKSLALARTDLLVGPPQSLDGPALDIPPVSRPTTGTAPSTGTAPATLSTATGSGASGTAAMTQAATRPVGATNPSLMNGLPVVNPLVPTTRPSSPSTGPTTTDPATQPAR
jgi:predicted negative regulator of RcsB-dependent stress response